MIDFRYHLVSLMAVLVALTLGVILGAGPLQGRISDTLSGQVDRLATRQAELQTDRDNIESLLDQNEQFISALGNQITPNTLKDSQVALIALPNADNTVVSDLAESLGEAGATVATNLSLTDHWFATADQDLRTQTANAVKEKLGDGLTVNDSMSIEEILALALADGLRGTEDANRALLGQLSGGSNALIKLNNEPRQAVTAVVVVGPASVKSSAKPTAVSADIQTATVRGLVTVYPHATLALGASQATGDLVYEVRHQNVEGVTTVDSVGTAMSRINVVFGLADTLAGQITSYGTEDGASQVAAAVPASSPSASASASPNAD